MAPKGAEKKVVFKDAEGQGVQEERTRTSVYNGGGIFPELSFVFVI